MASSTQTLLEGGSLVQLTTALGGLRIITERVPGVRSVAVGIWVQVGSRDETGDALGSAHYLEHLLFKGTSRRSALQISASIEAVGGELNAFTTKEYTCYHARVLDEDLDLALDVLCDVVTDALIRPADVEAERGVILEEIAMNDDDPGDVAHEAFTSALFVDSPLATPVLGTIDTIESITRDAIDGFYRSTYRPESMVVSVAGNVDHQQVVDAVLEAFGTRLTGSVAPAAPRQRGQAARHGHGVHLVQRPTEQAHVVLGYPGLPRIDDRRYAMAVLSTAFGGGMSSRLFQEVREKRGLAYAVYAFAQGFADNGLFGMYVGCLPSKLPTALQVCREQVQAVIAQGLSDEEIVRGKGQVKGSTVLGQEDVSSRMTRIARSQIHGDPLLSIDEVLHRVDAVTVEELQQVAKEILDQEELLAIVGPFDDAASFQAGGSAEASP
ncbi:MAG: M16 family metallopeptidase [Actinomycetales bacterium]